MEIITAPHQTLRAKSKPITVVDHKVQQFLQDLKETLAVKQKPAGVGLAANQVNRKLRVFAMREVEPNQENILQVPVKLIINPEITTHSKGRTLGSNPEEPELEGCLSIPGIYGPVPRWEWVEVSFQRIKDGQLVNQNRKFTGYQARIVQHETDHLNGILFVDHLLEHDMPAYIEEEQGLAELKPRSILKVY